MFKHFGFLQKEQKRGFLACVRPDANIGTVNTASVTDDEHILSCLF